jgi:hypothetical protein
MYSTTACHRNRRENPKVFRTPNGIRTRAATLKGWCPRPLDDGGLFVEASELVSLRATKI